MIILTLARKPCSESSVAANVLKHGMGGLNIDGSRIVTDPLDAKAMERVNSPGSGRNYGRTARQTPDGRWDGPIGTGLMDTTKGRWPANLILQHTGGCTLSGGCTHVCPVQALDKQSGILHSQDPATRRGHLGKQGTGQGTTYMAVKESGEHYADVGGASRFFKQV